MSPWEGAAMRRCMTLALLLLALALLPRDLRRYLRQGAAQAGRTSHRAHSKVCSTAGKSNCKMCSCRHSRSKVGMRRSRPLPRA